MDFGVLVDVCLGVLSLMILFTLAAAAINEMIADNVLNMRGKSLHEAIASLFAKYGALAGLEPAPPATTSQRMTRAAGAIWSCVAKWLPRDEPVTPPTRDEVPEAPPAGDAATKSTTKTYDLEKMLDDFYADSSITALMEKRSWIKQLIGCVNFLSVKGRYRPPSAIEPETFETVASRVLELNLGAADYATITGKVTSFADDFTLTMDRVSGWYVRKVKTSLFVVGLVLAVGSNVDLLRYADQLADDKNLRMRIDATVGMIDALEARVSQEDSPVPEPLAEEEEEADSLSGSEPEASEDGQSSAASEDDVSDDAGSSGAPDAEASDADQDSAVTEGETPDGSRSPDAPDPVEARLGQEIENLIAELSKAEAEVGWNCSTSASTDAPSGGEWLWTWLSWQDPSASEASWLCGKGEYVPAPGLSQIVGWLVIAFGVTLGAQFWFDLFRSLVNLRTPGKTGGSVEALSKTNTPSDPAKGTAPAAG